MEHFMGAVASEFVSGDKAFISLEELSCMEKNDNLNFTGDIEIYFY
jgi:hypothetical protein